MEEICRKIHSAVRVEAKSFIRFEIYSKSLRGKFHYVSIHMLLLRATITTFVTLNSGVRRRIPLDLLDNLRPDVNAFVYFSLCLFVLLRLKLDSSHM